MKNKEKAANQVNLHTFIALCQRKIIKTSKRSFKLVDELSLENLNYNINFLLLILIIKIILKTLFPLMLQ